MWAPGSYKNDGQRTTAPAPNIGIEGYFFEAGEKILKRIKDSRGTVILPERTGPIADVLYSAAGNSADDAWYRKGIIAYSFETGADRILNTSTGTTPTIVGFQPCFAGVGTGGGQGACPASGALANEGRDEALEFAAGNFGLVESAYAYGKDTTAPATSLDADGVTQSKDPINYRFTMDNEPSVIHYTTDGSTPTLASPTYEAQRARGVGQVLKIATRGTSTVKWLAVDIKGNVSAVQSKTFLLDQTAPTMTMNIPEGAVYTQGQPVMMTYACTDEAGGSGIAATNGCVGPGASGSMLDTAAAGVHQMTITATDAVGNVATETHSYRVLDAVNTGGSVGGTVGATLALTMGAPATFGAFTPGIAKEYTASTTATVISTAGDATLTVADPSTTNTGKLVNGAFALATPLQGLGVLKTWAAPVSNESVPVTFKQSIAANEPLRTGTYSKTLTFTLSTTTP
jgi:hypothetical protein